MIISKARRLRFDTASSRIFFYAGFLLFSSPLLADNNKYINFTPQSTAIEKKLQIKINIPFDEGIYSLAYQTFLANNNVAAAFIVAKKAVKLRPKNFVWHERLAQAARWSDNRKIAIRELKYITRIQPLPKNFALLIQYGNFIHAYELVLEESLSFVQKNLNDEYNVLALVQTYQGLGEPKKAIAFLEKANQTFPRQKYAETLLSLYVNTNNLAGIRKTAIDLQKRYGKKTNTALTLAETYYSPNQLNTAERALIQSLPQKVIETQEEYWVALASIAWILNDDKNALLAYKKLNTLEKLDEGRALQFLILLFDLEPETGLQEAITQWELQKKATPLILMFNYLSSAPLSAAGWEALLQITADMQTALADNYVYWATQINYAESFQQPERAKAFSLFAYHLHPNDSRYKFLYILFLFNQLYNGIVYYPFSLLPITLSEWQVKADLSDITWYSVYSFSYAMLNLPFDALRMDFAAASKSLQEPDFLNRFHANLRIYGYDNVAENVKKLALNYFQKNAIIFTTGSPNIIRNYTSLFAENMPVDDLYSLLIWLALQPGDSNKEALIDWALANNHLDLAESVYAYYTQQSPAWMRFKLALQKNDALTLEAMMAKSGPILPKDDNVTAANQINDPAFAAYNSVQNMRSNAWKNNQNVSQMNSMIVNKTDQFDTKQGYEVFGNVAGSFNETEGTLNRGNNKIQIYNKIWFTRSTDNTLLTNIPSIDESAGLIFKHELGRNSYEINAGFRKDLATFPTLDIKDLYQLDSQWNLLTEFGYHQLTEDTDALMITSVEDLLQGSLNYLATAHDSIIGTAALNRFASQKNTYIGYATQLQLFAEHKIWLNYPDYTIGAFAETKNYHNNGQITPFMTQVLPANALPGSFINFVPESFWQSGLTFKFGQNLETFYTKAFRPFLDASIFYNSVSKRGDTINLGIVGSIFGPDDLSCYVEQSQNSGGVVQKNYTLAVRYRYFF